MRKMMTCLLLFILAGFTTVIDMNSGEMNTIWHSGTQEPQLVIKKHID